MNDVFFRIDLSGERVPVSYDEIHAVRRLILDFYEDNLAEPSNLFVAQDAYQFEFWKYLSISFEEQWADSRRIVWVVERGCLAVINGMALDILNDQLGPAYAHWDLAKSIAQKAIPYLKAYEPSDPALGEGAAMLLETLEFMHGMTEDDFDEDQLVKRNFTAQGKWFAKNIVGDYYRTTANTEFKRL